MNGLKAIIGAMAVIDIAYICFTCVEDGVSRIKRMREKKKTGATASVEEWEFEDEEDDEEYGLAALSADSIRMASRFEIPKLISEQIFPQAEKLLATWPEERKEGAKLLLQAYIEYLYAEANSEEQSFPMLLELLKCSEADKVDAVELLIKESSTKDCPLPDYYCNYQKYVLTCQDKDAVIRGCQVLISDLVKKLYGSYYRYPTDSFCRINVSHKLEEKLVDQWEEDEEMEEMEVKADE